MTTLQHAAPALTPATTGSTSTRTLLALAAVAAPLWAAVSLTQAFTREGYDLMRHPLSMLSTGSLGWLQISNFLFCGALTVAGAVGLRRAMRGTPGGTWTPRLVAVNGLGMMAAGVFSMDPAGTTAGAPETMSWHAVLHLVSGSVAFTALIAACFVLGRHFTRTGDRNRAAASRVAGVIFILGDGWAMSGGPAGSLTLAIGVLTGMLWVSAVAAHLRKAVS